MTRIQTTNKPHDLSDPEGIELARIKERQRMIDAYPELVAALRSCAAALEDECNAAADDDHPVLSDHSKRSSKARALLAKLGEGA